MTYLIAEGGQFRMGSGPHPDVDIETYEQPEREVVLTPFRVQSTAVTRREWDEFLLDSGYVWEFSTEALQYSPTQDHPAVFVSWHDAVRFCEWKTGVLGTTVRLPTEAEWEWVCRRISDGQDLYKPDSLEFWCDTFGETNPPAKWSMNSLPVPVFGIWQGVSEWCLDSFDENAYEVLSSQDPVSFTASKYRVWRGGSPLTTGYGRCSARGFDVPDARTQFLGFRTVLSDVIPRSRLFSTQ